MDSKNNNCTNTENKRSGEEIRSSTIIETGVDRLVSLVHSFGRISSKRAAKELNIEQDVVNSWGDFLEGEGIISVERGLMVNYLIDKASGGAGTKSRVSVSSNSTQGTSKIEGSISGLERDAEEIRIVKSDFENLYDMVETNFHNLKSQFDTLAEFHNAFENLKQERMNWQKMQSKVQGGVEHNVKTDWDKYLSVLKEFDKRLENFREERARVEAIVARNERIGKDLKLFEDTIQSMKDSFENEIKHIKKGKSQLEDDEKKLAEIKHDADKYGVEIKDIFRSMTEAKSSLSKAERSLVEKVRSIVGRGSAEGTSLNKGVELISQVRLFLSKASVLREMLSQLERDRDDLETSYHFLVQEAMKLETGDSDSPLVKEQWKLIDDKRREIDIKRVKFEKDLQGLRNQVREILK